MSDNWKEEARAEQQQCLLLLGNRLWDEIEPNAETILRRKIGFGLYGPPPKPDPGADGSYGYETEQFECIEKLSNNLIHQFNFKDEGILFACIYVIARIDDHNHRIPIFKAKSIDAQSCVCIFVDPSARIYSDWDDWLNNNRLPACTYCAPSEGVYRANAENEVQLSFQNSPASSAGLIGALDVTSTVLAAGAAGLWVASWFVPVAGPVLTATALTLTASEVYGVGRSVADLVDRGQHGLSIGLTDREARVDWFSIAAGASGFGFASNNFIAKLSSPARSGEVVGRASRIAFAAAQIGKLSINGLKVAHSLENLVFKLKKHEPTPEDVTEFVASVLFFFNAAIEFKTAYKIIKEIQREMLGRNRMRFKPGSGTLFDSDIDESRRAGEIHTIASPVRKLNKIEDVKQFYELVDDKHVADLKVPWERSTKNTVDAPVCCEECGNDSLDVGFQLINGIEESIQ
ncbi:uncharacterized protein LOC100898257 [Galendromus occidentalis]|uniref:Uncharacterized protein LOC100898257 n=1 Tax=Galendromus occidentalis TaxID=34638 RepID=A0AAJ6VX86_9ACAR|nr:uncharacterized protein LOC100898257 [Galendromus occidentalis]